jgi:hypothetical protein
MLQSFMSCSGKKIWSLVWKSSWKNRRITHLVVSTEWTHILLLVVPSPYPASNCTRFVVYSDWTSLILADQSWFQAKRRHPAFALKFNNFSMNIVHSSAIFGCSISPLGRKQLKWLRDVRESTRCFRGSWNSYRSHNNCLKVLLDCKIDLPHF